MDRCHHHRCRHRFVVDFLRLHDHPKDSWSIKQKTKEEA
jgi:hypothetical protein